MGPTSSCTTDLRWRRWLERIGRSASYQRMVKARTETKNGRLSYSSLEMSRYSQRKRCVLTFPRRRAGNSADAAIPRICRLVMETCTSSTASSLRYGSSLGRFLPNISIKCSRNVSVCTLGQASNQAVHHMHETTWSLSLIPERRAQIKICSTRTNATPS